MAVATTIATKTEPECHAILVLLLLGCLAAPVRSGAETTASEIEIAPFAARHRGFFDASSTGGLAIVVPPGVAPSGTLRIVRSPLDPSDDVVTTNTFYDSGTTWSGTVSAQLCSPGPHVVTVRLPEAGLTRWNYLVRLPGEPAPAPQEVSSATINLRAQAISTRRMDAFFDEKTTGTWLGNDPEHDSHWLREDAYYALALFAREAPEDVSRANAILQSLCAHQDRTSSFGGDYGVYKSDTTSNIPDSSINFFVTGLLLRFLLHPPPGLAVETRQALETSLAASAEFLNWRFTAGYSLDHTNFQALGLPALALAGQIFNRPDHTSLARAKMQTWYDHMLRHGASYEFNSPVYAGVSLWGLKVLIEDGTDAHMVAQAKILHERLLLDVALHYNPATGQSAGPYSRTFDDGVYGGTGLTGFALRSELELSGFDSRGRLAENLAALHSLDVNPSYVLASLQPQISDDLASAMRTKLIPAESYQQSTISDIRCFLSDSYTLGTAEQRVLNTTEPFLLQVSEPSAPSGITPVYLRAGGTNSDTVGFWRDPDARIPSPLTTLVVQDKGRAIMIADHVVGADQSPAKRAVFAMVADERFAQWQDIRIAFGGGAATAVAPTEAASISFDVGDWIFLRRSGVMMAVQPTFANSTSGTTRLRSGVVSRGDGHLNIALHSTDSVAPENVSGVRVDSVFAVQCSEASAWGSYEAFITDVVGNSTVQVTDFGTTRTVAYSLHGDELALDYDVSAAAMIGRRIHGVAPARDLLADCDFAQQVSTGTTLSVRDLQIDGVKPYSWVVYPAASDTATFVNPASTTATITMNWSGDPIAAGPWSFTRLARPPAAEVRDWEKFE